ncbi:MAG: ATPase [Alphaproteobacteria bacterium]|nr:ATPase [Alphaproteobacteria bacterium]
MCSRRASPVIAIDGGGTRCRLVLDGPDGRHMVEVGSANISTDFDAAIAEIATGLAALAKAAGTGIASLLGLFAYAGLAGAIDAAIAARVAAALPLRRVRVEDDRPSALRGALGSRDGAIAHFGTGSFFAIQVGGRMRLAGGWGSRLGDEGSAFWVGRSALSATLEMVDGLIAPSDLTRDLLERFVSAGGIVAYAARATPAEIGAIARTVTEAASMGDAAGRAILGSGADYIARVADRMGWVPGMALCLTGGLGPAYRDYLPTALSGALVAPMAAPIEGAVDLARAFAAEGAR